MKLTTIRLMRQYIFYILLTTIFASVSFAKLSDKNESHTVLFNNLPRVALLVKEQYVDPSLINPNKMRASILEALEAKIPALVVTLPKEPDSAPKSTEVKMGPVDLKSGAKNDAKEKLTLDISGVKKTFEFEPLKSMWGMIFQLRDIFGFVEAETTKLQAQKKHGAGDEPVDWEKVENSAINGMLGTLDPHSVYLEPKYARDLAITTKGEISGIGAQVSLFENRIAIVSPIDGGPAARAGIKAKDQIIKIDDESTTNMDLNDAVNLLRGKAGTIVRLTVRRQNSAKDLEFALKRAVVKVDSVTYSLLDNDIGYLRIKAFQGNTSADVWNGISDMKKKSKNRMSGLILDLRDNPGGLLSEAIDVSGMFLDGGEIVSTKGSRPDSRKVEMAQGGELDPKLKIAVLVNGGSASASEIVAGALKNGGTKDGRAIILGERTFGKGSVQMLFDFPTLPKAETAKTTDGKAKEAPVEAAALKLTIAEYFGPNQKSIQAIGVTPDIGLQPVQVDKREEIRLFPQVGTREIDLEGHLLIDKPTGKVPEELPIYTVDFLSPKADEEKALEYGKLDVANLKKDFAVIAASAFIKAAKGPSRLDLLANAESVRNHLQDEEYKKIKNALKKYTIDWSLGKSTTQVKDAKITATITENKPALAGTKLKVTVKVKNTSTEPLFQVHGITHSKTPLFDQREFIFGKLNPGQELSHTVELELPKDVVSRKDLMTLELRDYRREKIQEMEIPLDIKGLLRPRFAHKIFIDDAKINKDSKEVDLTLWLKNIGEGKAFEPIVLLRNESGSKIFLKSGRFQSKELLPNQEVATTFSFRIKEPTDKAQFELQIFDGKMHDLWRDKIEVDVSKKIDLKAHKRFLTIKDKEAVLFERPDSASQAIATLHDGVNFESLSETKDYLLVKVDQHISGFIKKADTKEGKKEIKKPDQQKKNLYSIKYDRVPAQVSLQFGDGSGLSKSESGKLVADIVDVGHVSSLLLYVNGKKVLYKDVSNETGKKKIEQMVTLKPGINVITLFAGEDATYGQRESIIVFYNDKLPAVKTADTK